MSKKKLKAVDLYCGAGGTSSGLVQAVAELGFDVELTAINHWDVAIDTHSRNYPKAKHLCTSLDNLNPRALVQPIVNGMKLEIRFRMLQPHELAAAQSFSPTYQFAGNKSEVTKQIGNAVPVNLAKALITELLK